MSYANRIVVIAAWRECCNLSSVPTNPETAAMPDGPRLRRWRRPLLLAAGWLFTGLGAAGLVLPLLPGTVFLILAAWCFSQSSPRFEIWLLDHPRFGPHVRRWRDGGTIARRAKYVACGSMLASFALLAWSDAPPAALWTAGAGLIAAGTYVASRPEPENLTRP